MKRNLYTIFIPCSFDLIRCGGCTEKEFIREFSNFVSYIIRDCTFTNSDGRTYKKSVKLKNLIFGVLFKFYYLILMEQLITKEL